MPINIKPRHLQIVHKILQRHLIDQKVWVFGSRIQHNAKQTSDLDLCIEGRTELPLKLLADLRDDFSESNLPYKIDISDWHNLSDNFRKIIEQNKILLWSR